MQNRKRPTEVENLWLLKWKELGGISLEFGINMYIYIHTLLYIKLEKKMATHSNVLAWEVPWIDEPGGLQSMGSQKS